MDSMNCVYCGFPIIQKDTKDTKDTKCERCPECGAVQVDCKDNVSAS